MSSLNIIKMYIIQILHTTHNWKMILLNSNRIKNVKTNYPAKKLPVIQ